MALDQRDDGRHGIEPAVGRAPVPAGEEGPRGPRVAVRPEAPSNGTIRYHLGMAYPGLCRKAEAVSALRRAGQLDPKLFQSEKIGGLIERLGG